MCGNMKRSRSEIRNWTHYPLIFQPWTNLETYGKELNTANKLLYNFVVPSRVILIILSHLSL